MWKTEKLSSTDEQEGFTFNSCPSILKNKFLFNIPRFNIVHQLFLAPSFLFLAFQQFNLLYLPRFPYSCNP